jgi:uncharacterized damage-inducible protein DinB
MKNVMRLCIVFFVGLLVSRAGFSQDKSKENALPKGFRGEFLTQLMDDEKKLVDLAGAIPEEKYGWRPGEGVRSISEVYVHISASNFGFPKMMGVKPPDNLEKDPEKKITAKKDVIEFMKRSFEYARNVAMNTPDADLDKPASFFGEPTTIRGILFHLETHLHEHFGQSIAYARVNNIVPPWTAAEMKQQDTKK